MLYFDTLPKVLTRDQNGNQILITNIMSSILRQSLKRFGSIL
jgi:hypothetical protein